MRLVKELGISDSKLNEFKEPELKRRFYFKRRFKGPDGIAKLQGPAREVQELDEEF